MYKGSAVATNRHTGFSAKQAVKYIAGSMTIRFFLTLGTLPDLLSLHLNEI